MLSFIVCYEYGDIRVSTDIVVGRAFSVTWAGQQNLGSWFGTKKRSWSRGLDFAVKSSRRFCALANQKRFCFGGSWFPSCRFDNDSQLHCGVSDCWVFLVFLVGSNYAGHLFSIMCYLVGLVNLLLVIRIWVKKYPRVDFQIPCRCLTWRLLRSMSFISFEVCEYNYETEHWLLRIAYSRNS